MRGYQKMNEIKTRWTSEATAPLHAAQTWKERCMLHDGSVFTDGTLWTKGNADYLDRYFVQNYYQGQADFLTKLEAQLKPAPAAAKKLAAEMLWVMYLIVYKEAITPRKKRTQIKRIWEWSNEPLPDDRFELGEALEIGIAKPGIGYNTNRWRELSFFVQMVQEFKALEGSRRAELLTDAWGMGEWVDALPSSPGRQLRHILLFLLFPDKYDPIATGEHKRAIVRSFRPKFGRTCRRFSIRRPARGRSRYLRDS
jgi:5-methylcytosine-specific restriction enzyme B